MPPSSDKQNKIARGLTVTGTCNKLALIVPPAPQQASELFMKLSPNNQCENCRQAGGSTFVLSRKSKKVKACAQPWIWKARSSRMCSAVWDDIHDSVSTTKCTTRKTPEIEVNEIAMEVPQERRRKQLDIPRVTGATHKSRALHRRITMTPENVDAKRRDLKRTPLGLLHFDINRAETNSRESEVNSPLVVGKETRLKPASHRVVAGIVQDKQNDVNINLFSCPSTNAPTEISTEAAIPTEISTEAAISVIMKKVNAKELDDSIRGLAAAILDQVAKDQEQDGHFRGLKLTYKRPDSGKRQVTRQYVELVKATDLKEGAKTRTWKNPGAKEQYIRTRVSFLRSIIDILCGKEDLILKRTVLSGLAKSRDSKLRGTFVWETSCLDLMDCITIQSENSLSTNQIVSIFSMIEKLLDKNMKLVPSRLKKKIGDVENSKFIKCFHNMIEARISETGSAQCVFYFLKNIPLLCEMLITSSLTEGKMEDSISFSHFRDTIIFGRGVDRGGSDVIALLRLVNRLDGNAGKYCIPTSILEEGSEDYENLKRTVLDPERNKTMDLLSAKKVHFITLQIKNGGEVRHAEAISIQFTSLQIPAFNPANLQVRVIVAREALILQNIQEQESFRERAIFAKSDDRETPCEIEIDPLSIQSMEDELPLYLRLVKVIHPQTELDEACDEVIGLEILSRYNSGILYSFRFASPIILDPQESNNDIITATCQRSIMIDTDDGKMSAMCAGLGTCSSTFSCPRCVRRTSSRSCAKWLEEWRHLFPEDMTFEDCPLREGEVYGYDACRKKAVDRLGPNDDYTTTKRNSNDLDIDATKSVLREPLKNIDIDLLHGDALHLHEGILTHLTETTRDLLVRASATSTHNTPNINSQIEGAVVLCKEQMNVGKSREYKASKKFFEGMKRMLSEKEGQYAAFISMHPEPRLPNIEEEAKNILDARDNIRRALHDWAGREGHSVMTKKIKGAKEFLDLTAEGNTTKKGRNRTKTRAISQAEYLFTKAIRNEAGKFNKQNGGLELTGRRGMMAIQPESRRRIKEIVCGANAEYDVGTNALIQEIMNWWEKCAHRLYDLGLLMKSQQKVDAERLHKMKEHFAHYLSLWYKKVDENFSKNPIFWKLAIFMCTFISFAERTGMAGRVSAEGMENVHFWMNRLKDQMSCIPQTSRRVQKMSQRQQRHLLPGLSAKIDKITKNTKSTGPREGGYATRNQSLQQNEEIDCASIFDLIPDADGFVEIDNVMIAEDIIELYLMLKKRKVPKAFSAPIQSREDVGTKIKISSDYLNY